MPPLMIQQEFIDKLRSMYQGDDLTSILPSNLEKCKQKSIVNQLPTDAKERYEMKGHLKKASNFVHKYFKPRDVGLDEDSLEFTDIE